MGTTVVAGRTGSARPVFAFIGPSASGKSSVVRELHHRGLVRVLPTWTTRPQRPDERSGSVEHRFVTEAELDRLEAAGFFAETARPFGLPHRYGLPHLHPSSGGPVDAVMLRVPWVARVAGRMGPLVVYQIEDTAERRVARLSERGSGPREIAARIAGSRREAALGRRIADRVFVNGATLDALVRDVAGALGTDLRGGHGEVA